MVHLKDSASVQEVRVKVEKAHAAFLKYLAYDQQRVDAIVEAMGAAGRANARRLAEMAVEETKYGNVRDKIVKNLLNADLLPRSIRGMKTVGLLREVPDQHIVEYGVPVGVVAAVLPTTNPTSTVFYKTIISLKAGNAIVISPHPRAAKCTKAAADVMYEAAIKAGAPEDIIQCIEKPTMESTHALMKHERVAVILATGGHAMVKAAYSSGKPAFGVGPGNVPVYLERSADVAEAVAKVVDGKAFDYGTVCSSEQALVAEESLKPAVVAELKRLKAFFCNEEQKRALEKNLLKDNYRINPECVGQSPTRIAEMAGFSVPPDTSIIVVELQGVGKEHPLSVEKLSPVLALYFVRDHAAALDTCEALTRFGGLGHTCVIHSKDDARIREFAARMPAMRVLVNTASPPGSTGITTGLQPSMTLGCGAMGGNVTGDNVGPQHLINIKRLAYVMRTAEEALPIPAEHKNLELKPVPLPVAAAPVAAGGIDRQTIAAAVERYLAERGIRTATVNTADAATLAARVVDRFLSTRRVPPPPACPCAQGAGVCPSAASKPVPPPAQPAAPSPLPPAPEIVIADFVCESDVRAAIAAAKKIYIGPKTIVTPSARDLGTQHDILVLAKR
ncbi:MAG: aldehyde dehydrogenase family protein [Rhodospirillales bacterium]